MMPMSRRTVLASVAIGAVSLSGCLSEDVERSVFKRYSRVGVCNAINDEGCNYYVDFYEDAVDNEEFDSYEIFWEEMSRSWQTGEREDDVYSFELEREVSQSDFIFVAYDENGDVVEELEQDDIPSS